MMFPLNDLSQLVERFAELVGILGENDGLGNTTAFMSLASNLVKQEQKLGCAAIDNNIASSLKHLSIWCASYIIPLI